MKIKELPCPNCGKNLVCPQTWIDTSVPCPGCGGKFLLTHAMMGLDKERPVPDGVYRGIRVGAFVLVAAMGLGLQIWFWGASDEGQAIADPSLTLRCLACGAEHQKTRLQWEMEVLDRFEAVNRQKLAHFQLPEHTPVTCPECGEAAAYLAELTYQDGRCGHWVLIEDLGVPSEFLQAPGCMHCTPQ